MINTRENWLQSLCFQRSLSPFQLWDPGVLCVLVAPLACKLEVILSPNYPNFLLAIGKISCCACKAMCSHDWPTEQSQPSNLPEPAWKLVEVSPSGERVCHEGTNWQVILHPSPGVDHTPRSHMYFYTFIPSHFFFFTFEILGLNVIRNFTEI